MSSHGVMQAFLELVDLDPARRGEALRSLSARDPAMAERCQRLLAAHDLAQRGEFLEDKPLSRVMDHIQSRLRADLAGGIGPGHGARTSPEVARQERPLPDIAAGPSRPPDPEGLTLVKLLGRGGFGEVWVAENVTTHTIRAVKMIPDSAGVELNGLRRLTSAVQHREGLVQIEHVGLAGSWLFAVMPLADPAESSGAVQSLAGYRALTARAYAARRVSMPAAEVASIGVSVAGGLAALHDAGLAHGDVKPDNIMRFEGQWRLGDYSVVHAVDSGVFVGGTPDYLPPEGGGGVAADQYALAVTLFAMAHRLDPTEFAAWRDGAPGSGASSRQARLLDEALRRGGHPSAGSRFASMAEFQTALERVASRGGDGRSARPRIGIRRWGPLAAGGVAIAAVIASIPLWRGAGQTERAGASESPIAPSAARATPARIELMTLKFRPSRVYQDWGYSTRSTQDLAGEPPRLVAGRWAWRLNLALREPASCYVLYLQPEGGIVLCWPYSGARADLAGRGTLAPDAISSLLYPPEGSQFNMTEGEGHGQAGVLVIASSEPLPAYELWAGRAGLEWAWGTSGSESPGRWYRFDGFELIGRPPTRGVEPAPEALEEREPRILRLLTVIHEQMSERATTSIDIHAIFFPVRPPTP